MVNRRPHTYIWTNMQNMHMYLAYKQQYSGEKAHAKAVDEKAKTRKTLASRN